MDSGIIKSVHLVEEIIEEILIEEILSRLPVKSLLRFRCVSKSWLSLILSERFIEAHRQNSIKNRAFSHHKVIFQRRLVLNECSLHQLLNEPSSIEHSPIYDHVNNQVMEGRVMGSCYGLICFFKDKSRLFSLWNPATRISIELPQSVDIYDYDGPSKVGFGWDGTSGAYKVFASDHIGWEVSKGAVYSSKTNSWKRVEAGSISPYDRMYDRIGVFERIGVFACGKIHWHATNAEYIECFDLESEEFGRVELPFKPPKCYPSVEEQKLPRFYPWHFTLAEIGGYLHLLCLHIQNCRYYNDNQQSYGDVWVIKESRWLKLFTFPLPFDPFYHMIHPLFGGGPNGEIVLLFYDNYLVYRPKDKDVVAGESSIGYFQGCVYVESLVSPNFTTTS